MRFFPFLVLVFSLSLTAATEEVGAPSNAASKGADSSAGISESPAGTTEKQEEKFEARPASMGGAPNVGAGMGTGTGAGSKVGNDIEEGEEDE